jgi:succinate-semialdehyde dehydrogenase/glutarate-semialdehyde dehydrogenase
VSGEHSFHSTLNCANPRRSANRLYVHRDVVQKFTSKLVTKVSALRMGPGLESGTSQGPLVNRAAVEKTSQHVTDAVKRGAKVEIGGNPAEGKGFFYLPTVLSGVSQMAMVSKEETFGPLAPIFEFSTEDEVVEMANDTEFGLAGYFFSRDVNTVARMSRRLQVGMLGVNTGKISAAEAPFGGIKESGYGKEGSLYGLAEYQNIKAITLGNIQA